MNRLAWIMRPAASIETPAVKNGHRAIVHLVCGHVIVWKASRLKTYKPKRWRCAECHELLEEFLKPEACGILVERMESFPNDKPTNNRPVLSLNAGGQSDLQRLEKIGGSIPRRFLRSD